MLTFLYIAFRDCQMCRRFEDFPILPIGSDVYYAKDCQEPNEIDYYEVNLDEQTPNVCCYLEGINEEVDSENGPTTWRKWLEENGFSSELPAERKSIP